MGSPVVRRSELDELRAEFAAELEAALAPILGALELSEPEPEPTVLEDALGDPEGLELAETIIEKKSRAKRKPEGQDPLGIVPEPED